MATEFGMAMKAEQKLIEREKEYLGPVGGCKKENGKMLAAYVYDIEKVETVNGCTELTMTIYRCTDFKAKFNGCPCWFRYSFGNGDMGKIVLDDDDMKEEPAVFKAKALKKIMAYNGVQYLDVLSKEEEKLFREELKRNYNNDEDDDDDYDEDDYDDDEEDDDDEDTVEVTGDVDRVIGSDKIVVIEGRKLDYDMY